MSSVDSVGQQTAVSFGNYAIAFATGVPLGATGNAVITIPILSGGLTAGANAASSGGVIIRRVTVQNPNGNIGSCGYRVIQFDSDYYLSGLDCC